MPIYSHWLAIKLQQVLDQASVQLDKETLTFQFDSKNRFTIDRVSLNEASIHA